MKNSWEEQLPIAKVKIRETVLKFSIPNQKALFVAKQISSREPEVYDWIDAEVDSNSLFIDVGANFGQFALYSSLKVAKSGHLSLILPLIMYHRGI